MKTTAIISMTMLACVLAACARGKQGGAEATTASAPAATSAAAQPGMQPSQAPMVAQQAATPGPAQGLGQPAASAMPLGPAGNPQAGQQIAASGTPNGVAACVGCHGAQGEGNAAGGFPRIAGQSAYYIGKQLAAYANGARLNPIMEPIAKAMNAEQIRDVSAYYAGLSAPYQAAAGAPANAASRALQLATQGDRASGVQACANCHGPGGTGEPPIYPYLSGQHASYLTAAMGAWKSGARKTDMSGQMTHVARALSDADVAALSAYFASQPPPPLPAAKFVNVPVGSAQKPAAGARPSGAQTGAAAGVSGTGTEQGAPVMGGSQGSGGGGGTQGTKPPEPPVRR